MRNICWTKEANMKIRLSQLDDDFSFERDDDYNIHEENELAQDERLEHIVEEAPLYVNVYDVESNYGGPEEGGWYFNSGTLLESIPAQNEKEAKSIADNLEKKYSGENSERIPGSVKLNNPGEEIPDNWEPLNQTDDESYVHYEGKILVYIEEHPGKNFPSERPHYE